MRVAGSISFVPIGMDRGCERPSERRHRLSCQRAFALILSVDAKFRPPDIKST
jgi:hypothetical protein